MIVGLVASFVLLEVLFRAFWTLPPAFAEFGQAGMYVAGENGTPMLQPGYQGTLKFGRGDPVSVHINASGMRGRDLPDVGADGVAAAKRVLVAGDSLVFGYGVEDAQALPACIELGLQEGGVAAVVGNAGVPSFGSSHAVSRMALLDRDFQADALVVCGFLGNDAIDDALPTRVVYAGLVHLWPMAQLVQSSWRTRLAMRSRVALWWESWIFTNHPKKSPLAQAVPDPRDIERSIGLPPVAMRLAGLFLDARDELVCFTAEKQPVLPRLNGYLRDSLQRAKDLAGRRPLIFVILPTSWHVDDSKRVQTLKSWGLDPDDYEAGLGQARWASIARELSIFAFDATPILRAAGSSQELFIEDGGHLSVYGNEIVGRWLAAELAGLLR